MELDKLIDSIKDELDYESDIKIDLHSLDLEWLQHPSRVMKYVEASQLLERKKIEVKNRLEITKSELDKLYREKLDREGEKVTEGKVTALIIADEAYQEVINEYYDAEFQHGIIQGAVRVFEHRKKALENLVQLYSSGYFSGPKQPHDRTGSDDIPTQRHRAHLNRKRKGSMNDNHND